MLKSIALNPILNPKCSGFSSYHDAFFGFCFCPDIILGTIRKMNKITILMILIFNPAVSFVLMI